MKTSDKIPPRPVSQKAHKQKGRRKGGLVRYRFCLMTVAITLVSFVVPALIRVALVFVPPLLLVHFAFMAVIHVIFHAVAPALLVRFIPNVPLIAITLTTRIVAILVQRLSRSRQHGGRAGAHSEKQNPRKRSFAHKSPFYSRPPGTAGLSLGPKTPLLQLGNSLVGFALRSGGWLSAIERLAPTTASPLCHPFWTTLSCV
jgi:hypothetical protein